MLCPRNQTIQDYLSGLLDSAESADVMSHLATCERCRQLAAGLPGTVPGFDAAAGRSNASQGFGSEGGLSPSGSSDEASRAGQEPNAFDDAETQASLPHDRKHDDPEVGKSQTNAATAQPEGEEPFRRLSQLGRFRLKHRLGFGGFGVVYLAYDSILKREVALKLPRHVALADSPVRDRFFREAEAAAGLYHPNIVPLYEAGEVGDICYLASAYCPGPTLSQWMKQLGEAIEPDTAARITAALADAVEHAHRAGILHRDIKPGNVMLDGRVPMGPLPFTPRLTDFGLAVFIGATATSSAGETVFGTPRYMAPEQAAGRDAEVGPASEVYSLGVILYEMLTGQPPIRGSSNVEVLRRVTTDRPLPVSRWSPNVAPDLEAICAKCMEKEPQRRYATAAQLSDELARYLRGEPTSVRPDTTWQAARRWVRRNPAQSGLVGLLALTLLALVGGLFAYNHRLQSLNSALQAALTDSQQAEDVARETTRRTEQMLYASDMNRAAQAWRDGDYRDLYHILRRHLPHAQVTDERGFEWWWFWNLVRGNHETMATHEGAVYFVTISPDQQWIASAGEDAVVRFTATERSQARRELETGQGEVNSVCFNSDGQLVATAGDDGTILVWNWRSDEPRPLVPINAFESLAFGVLFARDDRLLVSCGNDPVIRLWDAAGGQPAGTLAGHERAVEQIALASDGRTLASAGRDEQIILWNLESKQQLRSLRPDVGRLACVAFSPDGTIVAAGSVEGSICLWKVSDGSRLATHAHLDGVQSIVFSPDSDWIYASDRGGIIRRWPIAAVSAPQHLTPDIRESWTAHEGRAYCLALSAGGKRLLSAGEDGFVRRWAPLASVSVPVVNTEERTVDRFYFADQGTSVVGVSAQGVSRWDLRTGKHRWLYEGFAQGRGAVMCSDGDRLALGEAGGTVRICNPASGEMNTQWAIGTSEEIQPLCFLNRRHDLAVIDEQRGEPILIYASDGELLNSVPAKPYCTLAAASPTGGVLAFDVLNDVVLWDLDDEELLFRPLEHRSTITAIRFSPDGRRLITASKDRTVKVWDVGNGQLLFNCEGHRHAVRDAALSPDGRTIASCDLQGVVKLWHMATGQELCNLRVESQGVRQIAFSRDGKRLGYLLEDGQIVILSIDTDEAFDAEN